MRDGLKWGDGRREDDKCIEYFDVLPSCRSNLYHRRLRTWPVRAFNYIPMGFDYAV